MVEVGITLEFNMLLLEILSSGNTMVLRLAARLSPYAIFRVLWIFTQIDQVRCGDPHRRKRAYAKVQTRPDRGRRIHRYTGCNFGSIPDRESTPQIRRHRCYRWRNGPAPRAGVGVARRGLRSEVDP